MCCTGRSCAGRSAWCSWSPWLPSCSLSPGSPYSSSLSSSLPGSTPSPSSIYLYRSSFRSHEKFSLFGYQDLELLIVINKIRTKCNTKDLNCFYKLLPRNKLVFFLEIIELIRELLPWENTSASSSELPAWLQEHFAL